MAITINGSGSISGISAGGLPDGVVTTDDLASTLDLSGKTVTLPAGTGGKVLQVVQGTYDTATSISTSQGTLSDIVSASITPSSASSKILVTAMLTITTGIQDGVFCGLKRDSTVIGQGVSAGNRARITTGSGGSEAGGDDYNADNIFMTYLDSPNTTSSTTYYATANRRNGGTLYINRSLDDPDQSDRMRGICNIILMEIAA